MAQFRPRLSFRNDSNVLGKSYRSVPVSDENRPLNEAIFGSKPVGGNPRRTVLGTLSTNVGLERGTRFVNKTKDLPVKPSFTIFEDAPHQETVITTIESAANLAEKENKPSQAQIENECPDSPMRIDRTFEESLSLNLSSLQVSTKCYAQEIYQYMRDLERKLRPKPLYMRKQPDITHTMRSILVDWLVEVAEEYHLHSETLYLSISYIDHFLSTMSVLRTKLQLVGTASMFIASKYEEIYPPDVSEFVYITDNTYSKKQVLRMEQLILKVLSFDLSIPTAQYFLQCFCSWIKMSKEVKYLAEYLCELSLLHAEPYLQFMPSEVACSALALACHTLDFETWSSELSLLTGYDFNDFHICFQSLHITFTEAASCPQQAIREKYSSSRFHSVALLMPQPLTPMLR